MRCASHVRSRVLDRASTRIALLLALLALAGGCGGSETRTQLTFSITASSALQAKIGRLSVVVRGNGGDQPRNFASSDLKWPVEIVVVPANNDNHSTDEVTLIVTALDAANNALVPTQTATARFKPEKLQTVTIALDQSDDAGAPDAGVSMDSGRSDGGQPMPTPDSGPGPEPVPDAGPSPDGGGGAVNCATVSTVKCDDQNPCNGVETCDPANASSNNDGCVAGTNVTCGMGTTCDRATGQCSACLNNADGDGDTFASVSCGGTDCNDNDATIAPGMAEACDGKDNNCDMLVDGPAADPSCASTAPTGGSSTCVSTRCAPVCTMPTYQIVANVCTPPQVTCPIVNPCGPGTCGSGVGTYTCTCPPGYRAGLGMTKCAPLGVKAQTQGFEFSCDGTTPTPGAYPPMSETKPIDAALYMPCGVSGITGGSTLAAAQLIQPISTLIEGLTGTAALASPVVSMAATQLVFAFSPAINQLSFDILGTNDPASVSVVASTGTVDVAPVSPPVVAPSGGHLTFSQSYVASIARVTVTYTAPAPATSSAFYVDQLSYLVAGCGDAVKEMAAGEACDDGNAVQCDGCDNACAVASPQVTGCAP